jgi:hypothetical protein
MPCKKLYYNYYTLDKYSDALLRSCRLTRTIVEKLKKISLRGFLNGRKKTNFEPYPIKARCCHGNGLSAQK